MLSGCVADLLLPFLMAAKRSFCRTSSSYCFKSSGYVTPVVMFDSILFESLWQLMRSFIEWMSLNSFLP